MRFIACAAFSALLLASGGANAAENAPQDMASIPSQTAAQADATAAFVREASLSGLFDVESAQLALDRGKDADVRKLAREIVENQTLANSRLQAFEPKYAQTVLSGDYAARLEKLKKVKAEDFDKAFLAAQKQSHQESVKLLTDYEHTGEDKRLKSYASETLEFLTLHQTRVNSLQ